MRSLDEYHAVRERAGLLDRSARGRIAVSGRDRASFLHGLLTNDIQALGAGTGCYAAHLTPQGRMVSDMIVLALGDRILLDVPAALREALLRRFDQFIFSEDVQLADLTEPLAAVAVYGPAAADAVSAVVRDAIAPAELSALAEYHHRTADFNGAPLLIVRDQELGVLGFDLYVDRSKRPQLTDELRAAGAIDVGEQTAEVLRVEAGRPRFGVDMDETVIPLEAGIEERAISFTKGCYVGQEVIIRVLHRGHGRVARRLVGLVVRADQVPAAGDPIAGGDRPAGHVTSAVRSPAVGGPIALGYIHRDLTAPGSAVTVLHGESKLPAVVTELPFVR